MVRLTSLVSVGCGLLASAPCFAQEPSGTAVAVITAASASGSTGNRVLNLDGPVFNGDTINTDAGGQAQIRFRDDTRLVVGPNSSLVVDKFIFNPDQSVQTVTMKAVRGTFRFFSGVGPKQAYSILTPTATIGIRGTQFDFSVESDCTSLASYEGSVEVCTVDGQCETLNGGCAIVQACSDGRLSRGTVQDLQQPQQQLPYAVSQASLDAEGGFTTPGVAACGLENTQQQNNPGQPGGSTPGLTPLQGAGLAGGAAAAALGLVVVNGDDDDDNDETPGSSDF